MSTRWSSDGSTVMAKTGSRSLSGRAVRSDHVFGTNPAEASLVGAATAGPTAPAVASKPATMPHNAVAGRRREGRDTRGYYPPSGEKLSLVKAFGSPRL